MIKKLSLCIALVSFAFTTTAQTIVSTNPENKNVILEEYTGINCVWCPAGHIIAQNIQDNNPNDVSLINIHVGGFANPSSGQPDFRTPFGSAIANAAGANFYPSGSINRHVFSGNSSAMGRDQWSSRANQILGESSYVNVGVEASIDISNNELTVHVEAYYTGNSPEDTNKLNIALLQNNTKGPQTGGNMGNEYIHMHRLVWMVTGQWGVDIAPTTIGTFIDETFTYTIPTEYNGIFADVAEMEVVAFLTETTQEVPTGSRAYPTYTGFTHANDANARYVEPIAPQCGFDFAPQVNIQNFGSDDLTSIDISYSVNGGATQNYTWNGLLTPLANETVTLPEISYTNEAVNTITITLENDDNNSNNVVEGNFDNAIETTSSVKMILNTDNAGSQCTWDITNSAGEIIYSGGPYENNQNIQEDFVLPIECYAFNLYDSAGNGGGSIVLFDSESNVIVSNPGDYEDGLQAFFTTNGQLGIGENVFRNLAIYPNPASTVLNIDNAANSTIIVYDLLGRTIIIKNNISLNEQLNVSQLNAGTYLMKISNEDTTITKKFIIKK